jgi:predicted nucleotide-binding protein (sugar kinase/HSP70/actin superfamily)
MLLVHLHGSSPLTFREDAMGYFDAAQTRTFKIVEKNNFSEDDLKWIRSLINVSLVTLQKKSIRVFTETEDSIKEIINSITKKYCNSSKPKLTPLFSVLQ